MQLSLSPQFNVCFSLLAAPEQVPGAGDRTRATTGARSTGWPWWILNPLHRARDQTAHGHRDNEGSLTHSRNAPDFMSVAPEFPLSWFVFCFSGLPGYLGQDRAEAGQAVSGCAGSRETASTVCGRFSGRLGHLEDAAWSP